MMRLGFVSAILPDLPLEDVLRIASNLGYAAVEVMSWPVSKAERRYAGVTHIDATDFGEKQAKGVKELVERYGVAISALGYYPNPLSPDQAEANQAVAHLQRVIEAAARLGLNTVNTFVGRDWRASVEDNWPRFLATWTPLIEFAEQHQVRIGIENCPMSFSADEWPGGKNLAVSPAIWRRMFADIPSPYFGLNYDPSHLVWQQMDYTAPVRDFADRIFHMHAKDVRIDRQRLDQVGVLAHPTEYHTPKIPGQGEINWGKYMGEVADSGYEGPVCVEVEDRAYEGSLEKRIESLRQSAAHLLQFMPGQSSPVNPRSK